MKKKKKIMFSIIAGVLTFTIVLGCVLAVVISSKPKDNTPDDGIAFDELFVRDVLENLSVDDIINDPEWGENLADSTDDFVMVNADKFDYVSHTGMDGGYSMLFFNTETKDIEMIQHSLVSYVEDEEPKTAVEKIVSNVQGKITELLGNPERKLMLMNTSGEFEDYEGLTVDQMIDKLLVEETVMYAMYKSNGIKYEINIMYSDETIYMMTWVYEEDLIEETTHEH